MIWQLCVPLHVCYYHESAKCLPQCHVSVPAIAMHIMFEQWYFGIIVT